MLKIIISILFIFLIGCSVNNAPQVNKNLSNEEIELNSIFSDFMDKNDKYPYLYTYKQIRWRWSGDLKAKFENKIRNICKSRNGKIVSMEDFLNEYGLVREKFRDRCIGDYPNSEIANEIFPYGGGTLPQLKLCVIDKKPIPKVLFAFGDDFNTFNHTRIREIVCLPNENNWSNNFKIAHIAYQMIKKREEEQKKREEELKKKKNKDIKFFNKFIEKKKMIVNYINNFNPYHTKFKISNNGKFYVSLSTPFIFNNYICGVFDTTTITPALGLGKKYSNYPNEFGGKAKFEDIICFNFKHKSKNINGNKNFQYIFEISPINKSLMISSHIKINKNCFDNQYLDLFDTERHFYCINGNCYPLQNVLNKLEYNFPRNKDLIIKLHNIECDLWKYYFSPNYVTKILVLSPATNKVKDIFYF